MRHAELYHLPKEKIGARIDALLARYDLKSVVNSRPDSLPLGMKQRLQLAVAVLHEPSILILDEPTSGVDPIARDAFWHTLIDLSRDDGGLDHEDARLPVRTDGAGETIGGGRVSV